MKIIIFIFTFLISFSLVAENPENKIDKKLGKVKCAIENYELCLNHENAGVVESTLGNIIKFKYRCPKADLECIQKQLQLLAKSSKNEKICRKALLVSQILKNSELVTKIGNHFYSNVNQLLDAMLMNAQDQYKVSILVVN